MRARLSSQGASSDSDSHRRFCRRKRAMMRRLRPIEAGSLLLAFLAVLLLGLAGCGSSGGGASKDEINEARRQGEARANQRQRITAIQQELRELRHSNHGSHPVSSGGPPSTGTSPAPEPGPEENSSGNCGGELSANQYTTCGFAENVEAAYYEDIGSGSGNVEAFSPTTGQVYSMFCSAGEPHECTGGNNAAVFFP